MWLSGLLPWSSPPSLWPSAVCYAGLLVGGRARLWPWTLGVHHFAMSADTIITRASDAMSAATSECMSRDVTGSAARRRM